MVLAYISADKSIHTCKITHTHPKWIIILLVQEGKKNREKLKNHEKGMGLLTLAEWQSRGSPKPDYDNVISKNMSWFPYDLSINKSIP